MRIVWTAALACALLACEGSGPPRQSVVTATPTTPTTAAPKPTIKPTPTATASAKPVKANDWLEKTLRASSKRMAKWLDNADSLRLQILVTEVDPNSESWPTYSFRADAEYFYPASAIKTFVAVSALRALAKRNGGDAVPAGTRILRCRSDASGCEPPREDENSAVQKKKDKEKHAKLKVDEEIRKLLSYSDNDSYNRLWDIVGHRQANEDMAALGFASVRLHHKMNAPAEDSKETQRVLLLPPGNKNIDIPKRESDLELSATPTKRLDVGKSYKGDKGMVDEPMSFAEKNYASLADMQKLNMSLLFPKRPGAVALGISDDERDNIVRAMTGKLKPRKHAADHKPLLPGVVQVLKHDRVRYVGKSGRAYGFHLENAYIEDRETKRGYFVTATVYVNPNGVLNDDQYDYEDTSRRLLKALGKVLTKELIAKKR